MKKWIIYLIIGIIILLIAGVVVYKEVSDSEYSFDFGSGFTKKIGEATKSNAFKEIKLNPFENET